MNCFRLVPVGTRRQITACQGSPLHAGIWAVVLCLVLFACAPTRPFPTVTPLPELKTDRIAFVADGQIYTIRTDGRDLENLTPGDKTNEQPVWSPDGKQLAFVRFGFKNPTFIIMNPDGTMERPLAHTDGILTPSWGPDPQHITYWGSQNKQTDIFQIDLKSLQVERLTDDAPIDTFPAWSPDKKQIAFVSNRSANALYQIYLLDTNTHAITALTDGAFANNAPAWSPNGQQIAFSCGAKQGPGICVMQADGSDKKFLVDPNQNEYGSHPSWSPDGTQMVYQAIAGTIGDLFIMRADGSQKTRVTDIRQIGIGSAHQPVWQPAVTP